MKVKKMKVKELVTGNGAEGNKRPTVLPQVDPQFANQMLATVWVLRMV